MGRVSQPFTTSPPRAYNTHEAYLQRYEDPLYALDHLPRITRRTMLKPNPTGDTLPPSPSSSKFSEPPIFFDAREVARRDEGWEDMLERVLIRWTLAVHREKPHLLISTN